MRLPSPRSPAPKDPSPGGAARVVALGQGADEVVGLGDARGVDQLVEAGSGTAEGQILAYRAVEQEDVRPASSSRSLDRRELEASHVCEV